MTHCSSSPRIACSLSRALLALSRDSTLRRSYLRRQWQGSHPRSQTAPSQIPRHMKIATERSVIHSNEP
jgi:hypothetical protein